MLSGPTLTLTLPFPSFPRVSPGLGRRQSWLHDAPQCPGAEAWSQGSAWEGYNVITLEGYLRAHQVV